MDLLPSTPLVAAATETTRYVFDIFVVLLLAKVGDEAMRWLRQPAIVGEILAGIIIGPSVLGWVEPEVVLRVLAEIGVVVLLFQVGTHTPIRSIRAAGGTATAVGVLGLVVPLAGAFALVPLLGDSASFDTSFFVAAALVATSVGITSAVLVDMDLLKARASRVILGAAIIDDVLAMLVLAVATGLAGGTADVVTIATTAAVAIGFVALVVTFGTAAARKAPRVLHLPRFSESPFVPALLVCLAIALVSTAAGLAAIIGAFLAGMLVAETDGREAVEREIEPFAAFFTPFFFVVIGMELDLAAFADVDVVVLLLAVTAVAAVTKFVGALAGSWKLGTPDRSFIALGMVPRGEVGIIIAGIGLELDVLDRDLFAVIVGMSILTSVVVPVLLRRLPRPTALASSHQLGAHEPAGAEGSPDGQAGAGTER